MRKANEEIKMGKKIVSGFISFLMVVSGAVSPFSYAGGVPVNQNLIKTSSIKSTPVKILFQTYQSVEETLANVLGVAQEKIKIYSGSRTSTQIKDNKTYPIHTFYIGIVNEGGSISFYRQQLAKCPGGVWTGQMPNSPSNGPLKTFAKTQVNDASAFQATIAWKKNLTLSDVKLAGSPALNSKESTSQVQKYTVSVIFASDPTKEAKKIIVQRTKTQTGVWQYQTLDATVAPSSMDVNTAVTQAMSLVEKLAQGPTLTLADADAMRTAQLNLKKAVEAMPKDSRGTWIASFKDYLSKADAIMANKKLRVTLQNGQSLDVDATDLVTRIYRHYKFMDTTSGVIDLDRFVGIQAKDLDGLETASVYFQNRQIDSVSGLPVLGVYSPNGHLQLVNTLVRHFGVADDGILGYIDGTRPLIDEAQKVMSNMSAQYSVTLPSGKLTISAIVKALNDLNTLNQALKKNLLAVINQYTGEDVYKEQMRGSISQIVNDYQNGKYNKLWKQLRPWNVWQATNDPPASLLGKLAATYTVNGKQITVSPSELEQFQNNLPGDAQTFLNYPGIKDQISMGDLLNAGLIPDVSYNALSYVNLSASNPSSQTSSTDNFVFSYPARRFQLLPLLLNLYPEVIRPDGTVDIAQLVEKILITQEMKDALKRSADIINGKLQELALFGQKPALTMEDYQQMKQLLVSAREEAYALLDPFVKDQKNWQVTNLLSQKFQAILNPLFAKFGSLLSQAKVSANINGSNVVFDPRTIQSRALDAVLEATSIRIGDSFVRNQYLRLAGLDKDMLKGLWNSGELQGLTSVYSYGMNSFIRTPVEKNQTFDPREILYVLIPRIVEKFQTIDSNALMSALLGTVQPPVPVGQSLEVVLHHLAQGLSDDALRKMKSVQGASLERLLKLKSIFVDLNQSLGNQIQPYLTQLSKAECQQIEWMVNRLLYSYSNLPTTVGDYFQTATNTSANLAINMRGVMIPVNYGGILGIDRFPSSKDYDQELFVGVLPSDFDSAETSNETSYTRYQTQPDENSSPNPYLSNLGRIQLVVKIVDRLLKGGTPDGVTDPDVKKIFIKQNNGGWTMDVEEFRMYVKGVRVMQAATIAGATDIAKNAKTDIEAARKDTYTIADIEAIHKIAADARKAILALLKKKAERYEDKDVNVLEKPLQQIFQDNTFKTFVSVVGQGKLVAMVDGNQVVIPAKSIAEGLINFLKQQFGDSVAAHSFSYFYALSMGDIRSFHKMEQYLGEQTIALPRNTTQVEIISQLSELGYMQMISMLVTRYGKDVLVNGQVNLGKLIALMTDRKRAVTLIKDRALEIFNARQNELEPLDKPLNMEALDKISKVMEGAKMDWVTLMNDFATGKPDAEALSKEFETVIDTHYEALKKTRDSIMSSQPFIYKVTIDGEEREISFRFDATTVGRFSAFIEQYAIDHPGNPDQWTNNNNYYPPMLRESDTSFPRPWIWQPRYNFDPKAHLTNFGMQMLFARLAVKFLEFVVSQDQFDMNLFMQELLLKDSDRVSRRLDKFKDIRMPEVKNFLDGIRDSGGVIPIEKVGDVSTYFEKLKNEIQGMLGEAGYDENLSSKVQKIWDEFIKVYEDNLFKGSLSLIIDGKRYVFNPSELDDVLVKIYGDGVKLPAPLEAWLRELKTMIEKGESSWTYDSFKIIYRFYPMDGMGIRSNSATNDVQIDTTNPGSVSGKARLADLIMIPAITSKELVGLDVAEKDKLKITAMNPAKLLGLLDVRAITPGSGVDAGGLMASSSQMRAEDRACCTDWNLLTWKSQRFRMFELIPELIKKIGARLIATLQGKIDSDLFREALKR